MPKNEHSERNLIFTVLSVTVLSTFAMIAETIPTQSVGLDYRSSGNFFGCTIHDVAQFVGAGFSVSDETGEPKTLVKRIQVTMLAPVVLLLSLIFRANFDTRAGEESKPPLVPGFVLAFLVLATIDSFALMPEFASRILGDLSR